MSTHILIYQYDCDDWETTWRDIRTVLEISPHITATFRYDDPLLKVVLHLPTESVGIPLITLPDYDWIIEHKDN
jgi:hypothetical protein